MTDTVQGEGYEAFFFDFDGVIVDSVPIKASAFKKLFEPYGKHVADKVYNDHLNSLGVNRRKKLAVYYHDFLEQTLSERQLDRVCERFSDIVVDAIVNAPFIPGIEDYLMSVYKEKPTFVISSAPDAELKDIIERRKLGHYFNEVFGSSENKAVTIDTLIRDYSLNPRKCIFYGDAESDYRAAMVSRVQFCAVISADSPLLAKIPQLNWISDFRGLH